MALVEHAKAELEAAGLFAKDSDYEGEIGSAVLKLIEVFAEQGHSGASASMTRHIFNKLANFEPICPLTGADSEWNKIAVGVWQNKRCSHVFKDADGRAYDSQGIVWEDPDGSRFTNRDSRVFVEFPYTPKTEIRKRNPA